MRRVTGIGGIFMSAKDPKSLCAWYKKHLGIDVQDWGGTAFTWTDSGGNPTKGTTVWSVGSAEATTSRQASPPSWSTIESKTSQDFSKRCAKRAVTCSTRPTTRSMESSDGSWIQRATKLSSGSRQKGNKVQSPPVGRQLART